MGSLIQFSAATTGTERAGVSSHGEHAGAALRHLIAEAGGDDGDRSHRVAARRRSREAARRTQTSEPVAVVGPSGVGKLVVCRALLEARAGDGERTLWFGAEAFETLDFTMLRRVRAPRSAIRASAGRGGTRSAHHHRRPRPSLLAHAVRNAVRLLLLGRRAAPQRAGASLFPVRRRNGHEPKNDRTRRLDGRMGAGRDCPPTRR